MRFTELTNEQRRQLIDGRARLTNNDRWFLIQLHRWFPSILQVVTIIHPETLQHLVRPAMSLAAFELGLIARFTRNAMIDAMNGDYALVCQRTAAAAGALVACFPGRSGARCRTSKAAKARMQSAHAVMSRTPSWP
jgi:hypothetical protein